MPKAAIIKGGNILLKREDIRIRDPFILCECGTYYMYASNCVGSSVGLPETGKLCVLVYESEDMENWKEPKEVFSFIPTDESIIQRDLWAPEVHKYNGKFYAFLSFRGKTATRGTFVAVSDAPDGQFNLLSDRPLTPENMSCIDGSLYVEKGVPYLVFSRDWIGNYIKEKDYYMGEIWAIRLKDDLSGSVGEAFKLFSSDDSSLSAKAPNILSVDGKVCKRYGSDAPFIKKLKSGRLALTWSPMLNENYVVLAAYSDSGSITGEWKHDDRAIFDKNGGHAMFFKDKDGGEKMCLHSPELVGNERAAIFDVAEENGKIVIK